MVSIQNKVRPQTAELREPNQGGGITETLWSLVIIQRRLAAGLPQGGWWLTMAKDVEGVLPLSCLRGKSWAAGGFLQTGTL